LQETIREGRAVIVAGTGVSIAASFDATTKRPHPQASWTGLLEDGLKWLKEHKLIEDDVADAQLKLLKTNPQTHRFISAAEDVTAGMGGSKSPHFADWLKRTIGSIKAHDRSVLEALDAIRLQGNLLATTNYDGLLLGGGSQLTPVTWLDADALIGAVRSRDIDRVIFLHGYWRQPESVILDWKSYEQINRDEKYREDLAAFWKTNIWVYVGCGVNGLSDPDFGLLLERYGERARQAGHWDYCLVRNDQKDEFQAHFDTNKFNIRAIPFGKDHADLPKYFHSLLPAPVPPPPSPPPVISPPVKPPSIPKPPDFYAEPDYIASHKFVGRDSQLQDISDWAKVADPTNLLLFDAIGGNGKSMLTWEWTTKHATTVRSDWAGRFWYSFYERGAVMADFCSRALAYMTGRPLEEFEKLKTAEMKDRLLARLHARPWLLILDGLERVLVAYHRIDAAEVPDEEANAPTDKVLNRNPCDTIRDEDGDLLRALAGARPSKILVSSRLTPRVLLNPSGQPIPGAKRITLPGLRPPDAEKLLRSCGIAGDSACIQDYLTQNCDNHPLVIGVLAGLIANYLPSRGNFDAWVANTGPQGGAKLNLASLDLIQRRNHILRAALDTLPEKSRQLLSTLALLSESADYKTLAAFNPHMPPEPEEVAVPEPPENHRRWQRMSDEQKVEAKKEYEAALACRKDYEQAVKAWRESAEVREAPGKLTETVTDLEQRGLLQYDDGEKRHDLHPVVRGVAAGGMKAEDRDRYGRRVVD
ncbi:MAG: SIR2 family protein, partial [Verrucomicrobiia bacterium]